MHEYLETRSDRLVFSNSLCNLASITLKNIYFENGSSKYHQKRSFAIGTKFTSPYSNLFITGLGKRIFQNSVFKPFLCLRCFDEIFDIWIHCSQKLKELFHCVNSLHPTIKFTMDYTAAEINFLGVTVTKVGNNLETNFYCMPTNTHQSLAQSCQSNVYKESIAYGQVVRFKRICSTEVITILGN